MNKDPNHKLKLIADAMAKAMGKMIDELKIPEDEHLNFVMNSVSLLALTTIGSVADKLDMCPFYTLGRFSKNLFINMDNCQDEHNVH